MTSDTTPAPEGVTPEAVAAILKDVTPAPWTEHDQGKHPHPFICGPTTSYEHGEDKPVVAYVTGLDALANRRFIAWARNNIEALAADLAAQKARADAAERERDELAAALDTLESDAGITTNGNMWRFWAQMAGDEAKQAKAANAARKAAEAKVTKLVEALEFYADRSLEGYDVHVTDYGLSTEIGPIIKDAGARARAALRAVEGRG